MAKLHPTIIGPIRDMLSLHRGEMKKIGLTVGPDGRNRCLLSPFKSSTSRNQPSNAKYIFGPSAWLRSVAAADGSGPVRGSSPASARYAGTGPSARA